MLTELVNLAIENNCKSIALPNISTGIYCYPKEAAAAAIAVKTVKDFLVDHPALNITFVCFDSESEKILQSELTKFKK